MQFAHISSDFYLPIFGTLFLQSLGNKVNWAHACKLIKFIFIK